VSRQRLAAVAAVIAAAVVVGVLVWRLVGPGDPTVTAPDPPPATEVEDPPALDPATQPPATDDAADGDDASEGMGLPAGAASVSDPEGDLADPDGTPAPDPEAGADLVAVEVRSDGEALEITFELAGPVPATVDNLLWEAHLFLAGERAYTVSAQQFGTQRFTGVLDWESGQQEALPSDPAVDGSTLVLVVPAGLLPRVDGPFEWSASTQFEDTWTDYAPDLADSQPVTVPFPADSS
jgi:hypothetical protein